MAEARVGLLMTRLPGSGLGSWPRADNDQRGAVFFRSARSGAGCMRFLISDGITVTPDQRNQRREQLFELRANDPLKVIDMYRRVVGLNRFSMLPGGMDFRSLIESILDFEAANGRPLDFAKAA